MRNTCLDELQFYRPDAPIVHVARRDAVRARFRIRHGYVADAVDGEGIVQRTVFAQNATVSVACVFAQADVCDDEEVGEMSPQEADSLDDRTFWVVGCGAQGVFCA